MFASAVIGMLVIVGFATVVGLVLCQTLRSHLDEIESIIMNSAASSNPRSDIPAEVLALASRLGVRTDTPSGSVIFNHSRHTWMETGDKPVKFASRQTASIVSC